MYSFVGPRGQRVKQVLSIAVYTKIYLRNMFHAREGAYARADSADISAPVKR